MAELRLGGRGPAPASSPGLSPQDHEPSTVLSDLLLRGAERCLALQKELKSASPPHPPVGRFSPITGPGHPSQAGHTPSLLWESGLWSQIPLRWDAKGLGGGAIRGSGPPGKTPPASGPHHAHRRFPHFCLGGSLKAGRCCQPAQSWGEINQHPQGPWLAQLCRQPRREGG